MTESQQGFAIVELFGHNQVAGRLSEHTIGGETFVRVDVFRNGGPGYTKLYGKGAIYAITITDEETAREFAKHHDTPPATPYAMQSEIEHRARALSAPSTTEDEICF